MFMQISMMIIKKLIIDSLGFSKQDSSDAIALINEFDADDVIKYFNKLKETIPNISKVSVWETSTSCATYYED